MPADITRNKAYVTATPLTPGLLHVSDCYGRVRITNTGAVEDYENVYFECTTAGTTAGTAPAYNAGVGSTTSDGSAVFTARQAWLVYARGMALSTTTVQFTSLPDSRASDPTWYAPFCNLYIRSGPLNGTRVPVNSWNPGSLQVSLALPLLPNDLPANTQFEIHRGCNLTASVCQTIFNNIVNRRGEEFVPPDLITSMS
jgi:hypothetical protein